MKLEQRLRDNLKTAAQALKVPEPDRAPMRVEPSRRHRMWLALGAAAAVLVLAVPALLLSSRGVDPETGGTTAATSPASTVPSTLAPSTAPSSTPGTTVVTDDGLVLGETTAGDNRLVVRASRIDEDPPTAVITLEVIPTGETGPAGEMLVGVPGEFFWNDVIAEGAVCDFSTQEVDGVTEVSVQIVQSASLGCSEPFVFQMIGKELTSSGDPDEAARQFVAAWDHDLSEHMAELAEPAALEQAGDIDLPANPVYSYCEGAAGSTYCTFEIAGGELVIRVRNEPPVLVTEVITFQDEGP